MNILYFSWKSTCDRDCVESLERLGATVTIADDSFEKYDEDEKFIAGILTKARNNKAEAIFSFNYFPDLSRTAMMLQIPYVSWVYDSPHLTLESLTLNNPCNHVFVFDFGLAQKYADEGIETVEYLPLACNVERVAAQLGHIRWGRTFSADMVVWRAPQGYNHDVTFLGRMYDDEQNFFSQVKYLPEIIKGYLDALIEAQKKVYGIDFTEKLLDKSKCQELKQYINAQLGDKYRDCSDQILRNMILKEVTVQERRELLALLSKKFKVDHFAPVKAKNLNVNYCGYADYVSQMPEIFYTSKININITLRSIRTGIPLRVIDILGAGGFCLTNYQSELSEYFENGVDLVWFESPEDMLEKAEYYLTHDEEREAIARNGHAKVCQYFSYDSQLAKIFGE